MPDKASKKTKRTHQKDFVRRYDVVYYEKPIITVKEAKKFFTKEELKLLSDDDLARIIGKMEQISDAIFDTSLVPQKSKDVV